MILSFLALAAALMAPAGASPPATVGGTTSAASTLLLVYRGIDATADLAVAPLLGAFAEEYGPDGLAVTVAATADVPPGSSVAPAPAALAGAGPALSLLAVDGSTLLAQSRDAVDLFAVYRTCETVLRGRPRVGYARHVELLLEAHQVAGTLLPSPEDRPRTLTALLATEEARCLFLPPGCSPCFLGKHAAAVADALRRSPRRGVLAYTPEVAASLRHDGWRGTLHLLPLDGAARILQLRQAGVYVPLLVGLGPAGELVVAPLPREGGERE